MELNLRPYCPVNGWDCPYWCYDGTCKLENPKEKCDDFATFEEFFSDLPDLAIQEILEDGKHIINDEIVPPLEECFEPGRPINDIMALNP